MRRKFLLKVMILSLLFVALGGGDLFAQSVTEVSDAEGLKSALTKSGTVKLTGDIEVETTIGVPYVTVTLDLNGHSIKAKSDNIYPINNDGILTITDSKGNGVIEGLGLSSGFDNNTNAKGPRSAGAELFINGGTFRNLNSETGAAVYVHQGEATINGGSFYGRNIAIMSANGTVEINGGFIDGYESAIVSSASVKIKGATKISGQCRTENGGSIFIAPDVTVTYYQARIGNANNWTSYETLEDAIKAAKPGDEIYVFAGTWDKVPAMKAGITINGEVDGDRKVVLNGTLTGTLEDLTLKNLHIKGGNAQRWAYAKGDLYFDNVTFEATSVYAIHFDGIDEGAKLLYNDCTIIGWAAMGGSPESCQFIDCTIKDNGTYGVIRTYFDATIEGCTFDIRNANPNDVYQDGIHAVDANVVVTECTNIIGDNGETGDMEDIVNVSGSSIVNVNGVLIQNPAKVGNNYYATIQDAIVAAAPNGTVELRADVTVDKWIMFSESLSIGNGNIITKEINGLTINGNNNAITIKSIESAGNGNRLFYDATNLNIQDLTIECVDAAANQGGIGLTSGTISNVNFIGGVGVRPGDGDITISGCTFNTSGSAIYNEEERDNLVVTGNTFNTAAGQYAIYLRGNTTFTGNTVNTGKVNVVSGSPVVTGNNFGTERFKVYNAAEATISNNTINYLEFNDESVVYSTFTANTLSDAAQAVLDAASFMIKVSTKVELNAAINAAKDGDVIEMTADIDYGTDQLKIEKPITLDLGGKTLTTRNAYGGMSIKNNPTIKNGNIVHASNTAAIKVWNATAFEDLVIDVQGKGDANKTIGGIVLQEGNKTRVGSIKNVTIKGDALTNGIETYNCGNATENVIGAMENVTINAVGTAMLISAPCGTATNCTFDGGVNGIEIWIKGNYSASLELVDCDVVGGVFAHDEFSSNPEIENNGTLNLIADEATEGAGVDDVTLTLARAENVEGVLEDVMEKAKAIVNNTYYQTLAKAVEAAETGSIITLMNGEHELPLFANKELTFKGESKDDVIVNDAPAATTQGWLGSTFHFENLTAKGATENYHGLANGVVAVTYNNCKINGLRFLYATEGVSFEGCAFNSNDEEHSFWTYGASNVTVTGCTFTYTDRAVNCYSENGADHELYITFEGCTFSYAGTDAEPEGAVEINSGNAKSFDIAFTNCTAPEKGAMWFNSQWDSKKGENTVVEVDGEIVWQVLPVAKIGDVEYKSLQAALDAAAAGTGNVTVEILRDIDLNGIDWNPVTVSAPGYPVVTVKGNSKTITGLNDMLFAGTWAGGSGLIINDLTIADSDIVNDKDDAKGTVGVGAFIGFPQASATITLNNCHLVNSTVEGGHWTGGLIGYSAGYAGNDGPVFMNLTIKNCSVTGSTITGKGSVGGIIGHGSGNGWTDVVIENTTVSGNTITSTGTSTIKAGAIMGTIGAAGQPTTANGVTLTGGAMVAATVSGNTVTSGGTAITTIYGRQGTETGILELNGGTYDNYPIERGVAYAKPAEGFLIKENTDGTFGVITLDGEGTENNPYIIKNLVELIAFRDDVNGGNNYAGKYIALADDIDLSGENWVGIGTATADHGFMGNFDGNGYRIKNLTITNPALDSDGYAYAGLFGVTEGTETAQNTIKNLTIENVTISTTGSIVAAAIAYPYYTIVENVTVCGNIAITGGDYTSGALAYTRRCVNASDIIVSGFEDSYITGANVVGGVISDIQMNGGLTANYSDFEVSGVTITGTNMVGGISGIISSQTLNGCSVKNVTLSCEDNNRIGIVSGSLGGVSTVSNVDYENVTGATAIIGATYDGGKAVEAKIGDTYYATLQTAIDAAVAGDNTIQLLADITGDVTILQQEGINIVIDGKKAENENYQFGGTIYIEGNSRYTGEETLTIQNVNFYTEEPDHDFIASDFRLEECVNPDEVIRYAHNVTVKDCNFDAKEGSSAVVGLRIRQGYDLAVIGGESNNMHSLMQFSGCHGTTVDGVKFNGLSGVNLNTAYDVTIMNSEFNVAEYAVRVGENSEAQPTEKNITITNNKLTSTGGTDAVIIVRQSNDNNNLNISENNIIGDTHIAVTTTFNGSIAADANYWGEGLTGPVVAGTNVDVNSYYADAAREQLIVTALTLQQFVEKVNEGNGTYNGTFIEGGVEKNITVKVVPASGDARTTDDVRVPNRIQRYTDPEVYYAQYQRFSELTDVNISNVNFVFYPAAVTVTDAWNTAGATTTADNINGELQLMNTGSVSFANCSFEKMSVSPFNAATLSVTSSEFNGLDAYAIKDIKATTATITDTKFTDCNGGFWFNNAPTTLTVTDNTFTGTGRRGAIQFSANGDYANTAMTVTGNEVTDDAAFLWQLNNTISNAQLNAILDKNNNTYETAFVEGSVELHLQGEGTEENPYLINDISDLEFFRDAVNADNGNTYAGKYIKLTADIDLAPTRSESNWTPIGNSTTAFQGTFDGDNHTISNLVINGGSSSNQGFFGFTTNGEIKNVIFENAKVSGRLNVGVVAGTPYTSKYTNIKVTGHVEVNGMSYVGGVGGKNAYANWTDITVDVDGKSYVKANSVENGTAYRTYVGGVIGFNGEGGHTFKNITSNIKVTGSTCDIGGIFGILHYGNKVENVSCSATVTSESEANELGGVAGVWHNQNNTTVSISNATFTGKVYDKNGEVKGVDIVGGAYHENGTGTITGSEAVVEGKTYETLAKAIEAAQPGDLVELLTNVNASEVILIDKSLTISGNGHKVTSNANRVFRVTAGDTEVTLNDVDMVSTAVRVGTNDVRGISIDIKDNVKLTLNNCSVDFTDASANDWAYAVNVTGGNNHNVTVNGGTYEGANVINVNGASHKIVVKDATLNCTYPNNDMYYGACIYVKQEQGSSVEATDNIFNGENAVAFNIGTGTGLTESNNTDNTRYVVVKVDNAYYYSLEDAFAALQDGATVKVLKNNEVTETLKVNNNITLDLNGKTITGTDNNTASFALIEIQPGKELTVTDGTVEKNGKITLTATNDRDWNAYSSVISNQRGKLTVNGGTIEHLGGTDMAYGIDNLTNTGNQIAETIVNGGIIKSTYRAIRQFLNSSAEGVNNILTINGGTIEGANKSIWMQEANASANPGKLTVYKEAAVKGDILLSATAGATEWPVEVSIAAEALQDNSTVLSNNVPTGYDVQLRNNVWGVYSVVAKINETGELYPTLAEAVTAAQDGQTIELIYAEGDAPIAMNASLYGKNVTITGTATVDWNNGFLFVGRGGVGNATLTFNGANLTSASNSNSYGIHVSGREKNTNNKYDGTLVINNSTIELDYLINRGTIELDKGNLTVKNGFGIAGRPGTETESYEDATATITLKNNSRVVVNNHNGMGLGIAAPQLEGFGIMNINSGSTFETTQDFLITAKGTMNVDATGVIVNGTKKITNNGKINFSASTIEDVTIDGSGTTYFSGEINFNGANSITSNINGTPFELVVNKGANLLISRFVLGYDRAITVYGNIEDAHNLTAEQIASMTPSLKFNSTSGVSVGGTNTGRLTAKDAYLEFGSSSWKDSKAEHIWNFENCYVSATSFGNNNAPGITTSTWDVTFDNSVLAAKNYIKNGVGVTYNFTNGSVATTGSLRIDGTLNVDANSSVTTTGQQNNVQNVVDEHGGINGTINIAGTLTIGSNAPTQLEVLGGVVNVNGGTINLGNNTLTLDEASNLSSYGNIYGAITAAAGATIILTGGTYTQDVNEWCHADYDAIYNGNNTWTVIQVAGTQTRELATPGWYWFSTYIDLEGSAGLEKLQNAFNVEDQNGNIVCVGNSIKSRTQFSQYYDGYGWDGNLQAITTAQMYMINTDPVTLELTGDFVEAGRQIPLVYGWNSIGYPVRNTMSINDAFENIFVPTEGDVFKSKNKTSFYEDGEWFPEITLEPGHGYMYQSKSSESKTLVYKSNNNRNTENKTNIDEVDYHWLVDATQYPGNMTIVAMLSIDNEIVKYNYEIAAFANGECRGSARPMYNDRLGAYILILTIHGEEVEELTFKYYDVNYGTEYELSNRINYSDNAIVGSLEEPYMFNLGILNIDETSVDQISIYPNPTTTGKEINLQAVCDKVEVFNALGVKVAEYTNVDSIDAIETAGIYVIRVTIDGNARNCRLVVR